MMPAIPRSSPFRSPNAGLLLCLLGLLALSAPACARKKNRAALLKGVPTETARLENEHTGVDDMEITVPSGYVVEWTSEARHDKYYVYRPSDTAEVQRAMVVLDVTSAIVKMIPDTASYERVVGRLAGHDVEWRERTVLEIDGSRLYQREMTTREPLRSKDVYHRVERPAIHAFVVGWDEAEVERLVAAVETLRMLPMKPNL